MAGSAAGQKNAVKLLSPFAYSKHRGCSHAAVNRAIKEGRISTLPGKGTRVLIDPEAADREWAENTNAAYRGAGNQPPPDGVVIDGAIPAWNVSRARREHYEAEMAKRKADEQAGRLIDAEATRLEWFGVATLVRNLMLGVPAKAKQRIPKLTKDDIAKLDGLIREALSELSRSSDADQT